MKGTEQQLSQPAILKPAGPTRDEPLPEAGADKYGFLQSIQNPPASSPAPGASGTAQPLRGGRGQVVLRIVVLAVVCLVVGKTGQWLTMVGSTHVPVWSNAGIGLAALLLWGYQVWPGIFLGALGLGMTGFSDLPDAIGWAAANTCEALVAAWLVSRYARGRLFFERPFDVFRFAVLAAVLASLISPPAGIFELLSPAAGSWLAGGLFNFDWWLGDVTSVVVLTPLLVVWAQTGIPAWTKAQLIEFVVLTVLLILVALSVFGEITPSVTQGFLRPNICLPFLVWAAFRFGPRETVLVVFLLGMVALWGTLQGYGVFADNNPDKALLILQGYMSANAIMCLAITAVVAQQKLAEEALRKARDELENRVRKRTEELSATNMNLQREMQRRQQAQEAHAQVVRQLDEVQETERHRISRELHDQMGQELTAMKLSLNLIKKHDNLPVAVQQGATRLEELTDRAMVNVHRLAWELRPVVLDDFGLETALRRLTIEWSRACGVRVDFHSGNMEAERLPLVVETMLFRVTQEALTNIARHAGAKRVSILLERRVDHLSLIVEDDGKGFDVEAMLHEFNPKHKLGLLGMKERVDLAGGVLDIESTVGSGTTVFVRVPLRVCSLETQAATGTIL